MKWLKHCARHHKNNYVIDSSQNVCLYSDFDRTVDSVLTSLSSLANSFSDSLCTQFNFFTLIYCRKHMSYVCTRFSGTRYYQMKDVLALFVKQNKIAREEKKREFFERKITRTNQRKKSLFWKSNSLKWSIFDTILLYFR